jgi:hypothetical protein
MDQLTHAWNEFWTFFREGLNHVNPVQVGVIALLGAMATNSFVGLFIAAALSVVIHVLVSTLLPVLIDHKDFVAPVMDSAFWHYATSLFVLYLVVIGVLFLVKMLVQRPPHRPQISNMSRH